MTRYIPDKFKVQESPIVVKEIAIGNIFKVRDRNQLTSGLCGDFSVFPTLLGFNSFDFKTWLSSKFDRVTKNFDGEFRGH